MAFDCPFLKDPARAKFNLTFYNETFDPSFVDSKTKYREYLFIVDNTDFPLFENPDSPFPTYPARSERSDLYVNVSFVTRYQLTEEYSFYIVIGGVLLACLALLLLVMIVKYRKESAKY